MAESAQAQHNPLHGKLGADFFCIPEWLEILKYYILIKNDNILLGLIIVATSSKKI